MTASAEDQPNLTTPAEVTAALEQQAADIVESMVKMVESPETSTEQFHQAFFDLSLNSMALDQLIAADSEEPAVNIRPAWLDVARTTIIAYAAGDMASRAEMFSTMLEFFKPENEDGFEVFMAERRLDTAVNASISSSAEGLDFARGVAEGSITTNPRI